MFTCDVKFKVIFWHLSYHSNINRMPVLFLTYFPTLFQQTATSVSSHQKSLTTYTSKSIQDYQQILPAVFKIYPKLLFTNYHWPEPSHHLFLLGYINHGPQQVYLDPIMPLLRLNQRWHWLKLKF